MKTRTVVYAIVLLLLVVFVFVNWGITTDVTTIVHRTSISLGALVAIVAGAMLLLDFIVNAASRYGWQRDRRTLEQEVARQRLRAEQADDSRIAELRAYLERELAALRAHLERAVPGASPPPGPSPSVNSPPRASPAATESMRAQR